MSVQDLLQDIPACIRCRKNHRRCDGSLPRCRNCSKAGVEECLYYDHITAKQVSRSHVMTLVNRISELRAQQQEVVEQSAYDVSGLMKHSDTFFGPRSCLLDSLQMPVIAHPPETTFDLDTVAQLLDCQNHSAQLHRYLVQHYQSAVHQLYPILDDEDPIFDHADFTVDKTQSPSRAFLVHMIYAISCRSIPNISRRASPYVSFANNSYQSGLKYADEATGHVSVGCLRNMALLALHALFAPDQGNMNQLVGVAARLCVDLNIWKSQDRSLRRLFLSILCIEQQISLTFDRPSFLQPSQITQNNQSHDIPELFWRLLSLAYTQRQSLVDGDTLFNASSYTELQSISSLILSTDPPQPNLISTLREIEFIIATDANHDNTTQQIAAERLLRAYNSPKCFHTFLTPQWIFRASQVLLNCSPSSQNVRASSDYHLSLLLLDRDATLWPCCTHFLNILSEVNY